ncbi:unnamed protein product [Phaedon cochleariae]|uniref:Uncharacterized protein n=1 Tax=Phaedon cochleariae TaxID=80249 RepID=A0A9N9SGN1_PHACE|nr:unnamed protein product [Phaedon cochleariae]
MENLDYIRKLSSWADANGLNQNVTNIKQKRKRESKIINKNKNYDSEKLKQEKRTKKIKSEVNVESENVDFNMENEEDRFENISSVSEVTQEEILSDNIPHDVLESHDNSIQDLGDELNVTKVLNEHDIILSIINEDKTPEADEEENHQSQLANKKKELMSDIFEDVNCSSRNEPNSEESDFFLSLI